MRRAIGNHITFAQLLEIRADDARELSLEQLEELQEDIENTDNEIKLARRTLNTILLERCETAGRAKLRETGRDVGTATLSVDEYFEFKFEVPKKVEWDQKILRAIAQEMAATGVDVDEYLTIKLSVQEGKFRAWPQELKAKFIPARTVCEGTPKVVIVRKKDDDE